MKAKKETIENIKRFCYDYGIKDFTINKDLSIDINEDVDLSCCGLTEIPININNVEGYFDCSDNLLTTLNNAPKYVTDVADYSSNKLTSFIGFPKCCGYVVAENNPFTSIDYLPEDEDEYFIEVDADVNHMIDNYARLKSITSILN